MQQNSFAYVIRNKEWKAIGAIQADTAIAIINNGFAKWKDYQETGKEKILAISVIKDNIVDDSLLRIYIEAGSVIIPFDY